MKLITYFGSDSKKGIPKRFAHIVQLLKTMLQKFKKYSTSISFLLKHHCTVPDDDVTLRNIDCGTSIDEQLLTQEIPKDDNDYQEKQLEDVSLRKKLIFTKLGKSISKVLETVFRVLSSLQFYHLRVSKINTIRFLGITA